MQETSDTRSFSIRAAAIVALASACLTWLCVGTFGAQGPLTAAVAVVLVELFLACFGMVGVLLATRISDTYLKLEARWPEQPRRARRLWLWRPLWQPALRWSTDHTPAGESLVPVDHWLRAVHAEMEPLEAGRVLTANPSPTRTTPEKLAGSTGTRRRRAA